jgi:hypothetical protein
MSKGIAILSGTNNTVVHRLTDDGYASFSGLVAISGACMPDGDALVDLGGPNNRFQDIYCQQQTVGAVFETGLTTIGIGVNETGTVLVWGKNKLEVSSKPEDHLVMGVAKKGKDQPIVFGAEPVLVTGKVQIGDFIVTSKKPGHGERAKRKKWFFFNRDLAGKIIGQALEEADGESSLIKCMINKT